MSQPAARGRLPRRLFILQAASPMALALVGLSPREAEAARRERSVLLHHAHTGETLKAVYYADGRYQPDALKAAARHLRDWRQGLAHEVDPELLDLIWGMRKKLATTAPIEVLCGYRSPATNALLRKRSRAVARHSLHMEGMAIDLHVPGRSLRAVRAAAIGLKGGGVGYYPKSGFVHVDTGALRYW
jgi:uncharacterized protein YcbK (DUF882 family)